MEKVRALGELQSADANQTANVQSAKFMETLANMNGAKLNQRAAGQKRCPENEEESSEKTPVRKRQSKGTRKKIVEDSDEEFDVSAGDIQSDLDYEENLPNQKSAAVSRNKTEKPRISSVSTLAQKVNTMPRKSAPVKQLKTDKSR